MKTILQNPPTKIWYFSGLTGMVLLAGVLLQEGQARTYPQPLENLSMQINTLHVDTTSLSRPSERSQTIQSIVGEKAYASALQKDGAVKEPEKKRMGLAMLFLGILAEEG